MPQREQMPLCTEAGKEQIAMEEGWNPTEVGS